MRNMRVAVKLVAGFLVVIFLAVVVGATGIFGLNSMSGEAEHMYSGMAVPLGDLGLATEYFQRIRVQLRNAVIYTGDTENLQTVEADLIDRMANFETDMTVYGESLATAEGRTLFAEIMEQYNNIMKPGVTALLEDAKQGMPAARLLEEIAAMTAAADTIADDLRELTNVRLESMSDANDYTTELFTTLLIVIIVVIGVAVAVALFLAFYISGLIGKPIKDMMGYIKQAGETGNLRFRDDEWANCDRLSKGKDEIGQTMKAFTQMMRKFVYYGEAVSHVADNDLTQDVEVLGGSDTFGNAIVRMLDHLNSVFGNISMSSAQVSGGASQVADGAQALAQGSTEQAATVEELSDSLAEISQTTRDNAEMAGHAAKLAGTIKSNAEKGSRQMDEMMSAVKDINQSSQDISRVIKVIDDIAFQTNILALNAAVEAARAGQHGKGFTVVAEEVRSLAAKSAEAASGTESLIAASMERAALGVRIAGETAASLTEIVSGINESSQLIARIADSSEEQAASISQINVGIDQVAMVVQQNSATAEESAAASEEMSGQSTMLRELISRFRIKGEDSRHLLPGKTGRKPIKLPDETGLSVTTSHNGYGFK